MEGCQNVERGRKASSREKAFELDPEPGIKESEPWACWSRGRKLRFQAGSVNTRRERKPEPLNTGIVVIDEPLALTEAICSQPHHLFPERMPSVTMLNFPPENLTL